MIATRRALVGIALLLLAAAAANGRVFFAPKRVCPIRLQRVDEHVESALIRTTLRLHVVPPPRLQWETESLRGVTGDETLAGVTLEGGDLRFEGLLVEEDVVRRLRRKGSRRLCDSINFVKAAGGPARFTGFPVDRDRNVMLSLAYVRPLPDLGGSYRIGPPRRFVPIGTKDCLYSLRIVAPVPVCNLRTIPANLLSERPSSRQIHVWTDAISPPITEIRGVQAVMKVPAPTLVVETFCKRAGKGTFAATIVLPTTGPDAGEDLSEARMVVRGVDVDELEPTPLPVVPRASREIITGRYEGGGAATVTVSGLLGDRAITLTRKVEFRKTPGGPRSIGDLFRLRETPRPGAGFLLVLPEDRAKVDPRNADDVRAAIVRVGEARDASSDWDDAAFPVNAHDHALLWLAGKQEDDGRWKGTAGMGDPAVTGLALLAFLSAGETHKTGEYRRCVRNGLKYLKTIQDEDGCFGSRDRPGYLREHAWAAFAMTEAYALTGSPLFKQSAQDGVNFIEKAREPGGGWGTKPGGPSLTSMTVPMIMVLKSAKEAGRLHVQPAVFEEVCAWLDTVTDPETGLVSDLPREDPGDANRWLTPGAVLARILCGENPRKSAIIEKGIARCVEHCPARGSVDAWSWYFGTVSVFQFGREPWKSWRRALDDAVIPGQQRGPENTGWWDPAGEGSEDLGRVGTTALMTMSLLAGAWRY